MKLLHFTITLSFFAVLLLPLAIHATGACGVDNAIQMSVYIPGVTGVKKATSVGESDCYYLKKIGANDGDKTSGGSLPDYIAGMYYLGVRLGGLIALLMLMIGGAEWVFAQGSPEKISKSKERMVNALVGLMLLLVSYTILNLINPQLVELKSLNLEPVKAKEVATAESQATGQKAITLNNLQQARMAYDKNPTEENKRLLAEATAANDAAQNKLEQIAQQQNNIATTAVTNSLRSQAEGQTTDALLSNAMTALKKIYDMDPNNAVGRAQAIQDFLTKSSAGTVLQQRIKDENNLVSGRIVEIIDAVKKENNLNITNATDYAKIKTILNNNPEYLQLVQQQKQLTEQQRLYDGALQDLREGTSYVLH